MKVRQNMMRSVDVAPPDVTMHLSCYSLLLSQSVDRGRYVCECHEFDTN